LETNVTLRAFSVDHAARVTGLGRARLTRWDRLGFFSPEYCDEDDRGNPYSRVYSYSDLVGLKTLGTLTDQYHVPLSEIRRAYSELVKQWKRPWSEIRFGVLKRKIVFDLDGQPRNVSDGQFVLKHFPLLSIAEDVRNRTNELRSRSPELIGKIERHKFVAHNAYVLAGTRIPVRVIESFILAGYTDDAVVIEYPSLTVVDVSAVRRKMKVAA
jgi:uncharacterized protein (DUF433 family)